MSEQSQETPVVILRYPSIFFRGKKQAELMARHAIGMPRLDADQPTEVVTAWVEGDEETGIVYATVRPRIGPNMLTLEYLKMRELLEEGHNVVIRMDASFLRLSGTAGDEDME